MKNFIIQKETTKEVTTREIYGPTCLSLTDIFIDVAQRGYRIVGFERPKQGQEFLASDLTILTANEDFKYDPYLILEKIPANLTGVARVVRTETSVKDVYGDLDTNKLKNVLTSYKLKIVGFRLPLAGETYLSVDGYTVRTAVNDHVEDRDCPRLILVPIENEIAKSVDEFLGA